MHFKLNRAILSLRDTPERGGSEFVRLPEGAVLKLTSIGPASGMVDVEMSGDRLTMFSCDLFAWSSPYRPEFLA